ncbi:MAG: hypothetical protein ACLUQ6_09360, partial [Alistipes onderdonkii]
SSTWRPKVYDILTRLHDGAPKIEARRGDQERTSGSVVGLTCRSDPSPQQALPATRDRSAVSRRPHGRAAAGGRESSPPGASAALTPEVEPPAVALPEPSK